MRRETGKVTAAACRDARGDVALAAVGEEVDRSGAEPLAGVIPRVYVTLESSLHEAMYVGVE
jgi:hypothetical protein